MPPGLSRVDNNALQFLVVRLRLYFKDSIMVNSRLNIDCLGISRDLVLMLILQRLTPLFLSFCQIRLPKNTSSA